MPSPAENRIQLTLPHDHAEAVREAAQKAKLPISTWIGAAILDALPARVRAGLSERRGRGRPRKEEE
jgi:hypothetical protein